MLPPAGAQAAIPSAVLAAPALQIKKEFRHLYLMSDSLKLAHQLWPHLRSGSAQQHPPASAYEAQAQWAVTISSVIKISESVMLQYGLTAQARNLIHEGSRVLFPTIEDSSTGVAMAQGDSASQVTPLGWKHLKTVSSMLSGVLRHWEAKLIHPQANFCKVPAALVVSRAMLHWFQCYLHHAGHLDAASIEDARLGPKIESLRGWHRGPRLQNGLASVCSRLLAAQSLATDATFAEPFSIVMASLFLARLLSGAGGGSTFKPRHLLTLPVQSPSPHSRNVSSEAKVTVKHVRVQSREALEVAIAYLRSACSVVKVGISPVDLLQVQQRSDVEDSETLWEAHCLHRSLQQRLDADDGEII